MYLQIVVPSQSTTYRCSFSACPECVSFLSETIRGIDDLQVVGFCQPARAAFSYWPLAIGYWLLAIGSGLPVFSF
jgi:hypothetical protein